MSVSKSRKIIDALDKRILEALNSRAKISQKIGKIKNEIGAGIYSPEREMQVLDHLKSINKGPLTPQAIDAIYREIMSSSISLEKKIKIAYLGPYFTFTHQAAHKKFGSSVDYVPCGSISDVFIDVEKGSCDYGVVPVENSTEGAVNHTLDMFIDSNLKISAEMYVTIHHNLLARRRAFLKTKNQKTWDIKRVYSNPQVFGQCRLWLETYLKDAELIEESSTSQAAKRIAEGKDTDGNACLASLMAANFYDLKVLAPSIEDNSGNTTRFLVIARFECKPTGKDKTSLVFGLKDKVGALHDTLSSFKKAGINLTKIESRPSKRKAWSYYFYVDFEGHEALPHIRRAITDLEKNSTFLKVLGSYPKGQ